MMIPQSKPNPRLDQLLEMARARGPMTAAEIDAQRRSFVRAEAGFGSDADEAAYAKALHDGDKVTLERLRAEAGARVAAADAYMDANYGPAPAQPEARQADEGGEG